MPLQGDAGVYECHANNKWSMDMRSFRFGAEKIPFKCSPQHR